MLKTTTLGVLFCLTCINAKLPTVCNYGKYVADPMNDTECLDCPEGKYRDTVRWNVACKLCPVGQVSGSASISCQNTTVSAEVDEKSSPTVAAGGVGVAAGATIGVAYYASST